SAAVDAGLAARRRARCRRSRRSRRGVLDYGGYHAGQGGDVEPLGRLDFGDERYDWSQLAPEWTTSVERTTTAAPCGWVEENIFYPGNDLQDGSKVPSPEECCAQCAQNSECVGWSWERSTWDCALKGNKPRPMLAKLADERYVSGQPTQASSQPWCSC
ncbi:unnamed protein product, partial [Prorocentrum cordatum]